MPNAAAKFSSEYLSADQIASALQQLPAVLLEIFGECSFTAYYGWATKIHGDLQYKPMRVRTDDIQWLIEDSIDQKIVVPGESDLLLKSPEKEIELLFCHESDIHVDGDSLERMQQFMATDPFSEFQWYSQSEVKAQIERDRQQ